MVLLQKLYDSMSRALQYLATRDTTGVGVPSSQADNAWADWVRPLLFVANVCVFTSSISRTIERSTLRRADGR